MRGTNMTAYQLGKEDEMSTDNLLTIEELIQRLRWPTKAPRSSLA